MLQKKSSIYKGMFMALKILRFKGVFCKKRLYIFREHSHKNDKFLF